MNNINEIKALMRYYLLMCNHDLSNHNYAAVDADGGLFVYDNEPRVDYRDNEWLDNDYQHITMLEKCELWKDTLIKL